MQAAIGLAQLQKLPNFIKARKENYKKLYSALSRYSKFFLFMEVEKEADPSWFGFPIVIRENAPFTRLELVRWLEDHKIGTRNLFAGNLLKHPAYLGRRDVRVVGNLTNSDTLMNDAFWIGVYPGITDRMIRYVASSFDAFFASLSTRSAVVGA